MNSMTNTLPVNNLQTKQSLNDKVTPSRLYFYGKLIQSILIRPVTTTAILAFRTFKLLTWVPVKTGLYKLSGFHTEAAAYFENECLRTVKVVRDIIYIPSVVKRAYIDATAPRESFVDDVPRMKAKDYLQVRYNTPFEQYSSYMHGISTFEVIHPEGINEFAAASDASLNTIMASHLFKSGMLAINFGCPNVATFMTTEEKGEIQTLKVDAKSLKREKMNFHATNGKIQSGVFLVPTNLPDGALARFQAAAEQMKGRADVTCVNTNSRVLHLAGFSIEGVVMEAVIFPGTLLEHMLFRNVFYTDSNGVKHKVHFDIINTTKNNLEEHMEIVDTAVVGTYMRHRRRNKDTVENQNARGEAAKALIAEEKARLKDSVLDASSNFGDLTRRKVSISVPSFIGNAIAGIWGRHTIYEMDLIDAQSEMRTVFERVAGSSEVLLRPFPDPKVSLATRLKRDFFFSGPMIRFLRRHMMGQEDTLYMNSHDLFTNLRSTAGSHFNYVLLKDKVVIAKVNANVRRNQPHRKAADWALSKHALIANRENVYCSGEMWYDAGKRCFRLNSDSGTYKPGDDRVQVVVSLANKFFGDRFRIEHKN